MNREDVMKIINQPSPQFITQDDMISVVEFYIKDRKGTDVEIDLLKYVDKNISPFIKASILTSEIKKLERAYNYVTKYYNNTL